MIIASLLLLLWVLELNLALLEIAPELDNIRQHVLDKVIEAHLYLFVLVEDL